MYAVNVDEEVVLRADDVEVLLADGRDVGLPEQHRSPLDSHLH